MDTLISVTKFLAKAISKVTLYVGKLKFKGDESLGFVILVVVAALSLFVFYHRKKEKPESSPQRTEIPEGMKAMRVKSGAGQQVIRDRHDLFVVNKGEQGTAVGELYAAGSNYTEEIHGGGMTMAVGYDDKDLKEVTKSHKETAGQHCLVKIKMKKDGKIFKRKFKPTQTVDEVGMALMKAQEKFFRIFRDGKELNGNLTVAQAAQNGSLLNWEAEQ